MNIDYEAYEEACNELPKADPLDHAVSLNDDTFCPSCDSHGRCTYACNYGCEYYHAMDSLNLFNHDCD